MLLVSLHCPFLIAPSVFSSVYSPLCLVWSMLSVSLHCPFLIATSVFSSVYSPLCLVWSMLSVSLHCPFLIAPSVFSSVYSPLCLVWSMLWVSLHCPFLIAPSVFSSVYSPFCLVWSKLSVFLHCPFFIATSGFCLFRGTNRLIEKSRSCTIVNRVFWFVNDSVTSSCTIILSIRTWFLDGKPQLLLIKETIINYLFAVPFLYCISLMVYAPKLSLI
jgi:hypothetical protein